MNKSTVVLVGGSGFIGRHLAADFAVRGWRVIILSRYPEKIQQCSNANYEYIHSFSQLDEHISPDLIINLAGASVGAKRWTNKRKQILLQSRLQPLRQLNDLLAQTKQRPKHIIQASAVGYYGKNDSDNRHSICTENTPPQEIFLSQLCQQWEKLAYETAQYGTPVTICRLGVVLGHGGGILTQLLRPISLGIGSIGSGQQPLSWIHIADVVSALHFVAERPPAQGVQIYNFTAPELITQYEFARTAARLMHRPLPFRLPAMMMRLLLGEQADLVLTGQFVTPERLQNEGYAFQFPTITQALTDLLNV